MADDDQNRPRPASVPVTWKSGENQIKSRAPVIAEPSARDAALFGNPDVRTCGSCRFFQPREKDPRGLSKFLKLAVHEAKWQLGWIAPEPEKLGRCGMNEQLAVGPHSRSCDQYREGSGRIR